MTLRAWLEKDLYRGDLRALRDVARGSGENVDISQLSRLRSRGFITKIILGKARLLPKGALALLLRATIARPLPEFEEK
jgi:hypothetical protein